MQSDNAAVLLDWGDTLMRDFDVPGPMCDWLQVEAMPEARQALQLLSPRVAVYVASGSTASTPMQVLQALARVDLAHMCSGVFLAKQWRCSKTSPEFYKHIAQSLQLLPERMVMLGNDLAQDVLPARAAGVHGLWVPLTAQPHDDEPAFTLLQAAHAALSLLNLNDEQAR